MQILPFRFTTTNYQIGIVTLNHMIVYKLLVLDRNTRYHITMQTNYYYNQINDTGLYALLQIDLPLEIYKLLAPESRNESSFSVLY